LYQGILGENAIPSSPINTISNEKASNMSKTFKYMCMWGATRESASLSGTGCIYWKIPYAEKWGFKAVETLEDEFERGDQ
jgi:lysyl-tRNA synthetase class I